MRENLRAPYKTAQTTTSLGVNSIDNILFTPPSDQQIMNEEKTMTARFWKKRPPFVGEIVTASTGRRKETQFAKLRILHISTWQPGHTDAHMLLAKTGYTPQQIAEKEGFKNFNEFFNTYAILNNHLDPHDKNRSHYFIEFEIVEVL